MECARAHFEHGRDLDHQVTDLCTCSMPLERALKRTKRSPIWGYACARLNATSTQRPTEWWRTIASAASSTSCDRLRVRRRLASLIPPRRARPAMLCNRHLVALARRCTDILDSGPLTPATLNACARALSVGVHRLFDAHIDRRPPPCAVAGLSHLVPHHRPPLRCSCLHCQQLTDEVGRAFALVRVGCVGHARKTTSAPPSAAYTCAPAALFMCVCALTCTVAH